MPYTSEAVRIPYRDPQYHYSVYACVCGSREFAIITRHAFAHVDSIVCATCNRYQRRTDDDSQMRDARDRQFPVMDSVRQSASDFHAFDPANDPRPMPGRGEARHGTTGKVHTDTAMGHDDLVSIAARGWGEGATAGYATGWRDAIKYACSIFASEIKRRSSARDAGRASARDVASDR